MHGTVHGPGYSGANGISIAAASWPGRAAVGRLPHLRHRVVRRPRRLLRRRQHLLHADAAAAAGRHAVGVRSSVRHHLRPGGGRRVCRARPTPRTTFPADAARRLRARLRAAAVSARVRPLLLFALVAGCTACGVAVVALAVGRGAVGLRRAGERVDAQLQPAAGRSGALAHARRHLRAAVHLERRRRRLGAVVGHGLSLVARPSHADGDHARRRRAGPTARPSSADDVSFTFELLHRQRALDASGVWDFLAGVRTVDARTVELTLARPFVPGLVELLQQSIVPAHLWRAVADPLDLHEPQSRRHRTIHRGARLSQPGVGARPQPALLAAGQARARRRCA